MTQQNGDISAKNSTCEFQHTRVSVESTELIKNQEQVSASKSGHEKLLFNCLRFLRKFVFFVCIFSMRFELYMLSTLLHYSRKKSNEQMISWHPFQTCFVTKWSTHIQEICEIIFLKSLNFSLCYMIQSVDSGCFF